MSEIFNSNDLIMYQEDGKIMSGGYAVNSILMNSGQSPLNSYYYGGSKSLESKKGLNENENKNEEIEDETKEQDKRSTVFDNLAVPVGIFYMNSDYIKTDYNKTNNNTYNQRYMLSDDIYDKLFELASFKQPKKTTNNKVTNNKVTNNKITKKNNKQDGQNKKTRRVKM
jgi:hypothetical protein